MGRPVGCSCLYECLVSLLTIHSFPYVFLFGRVFYCTPLDTLYDIDQPAYKYNPNQPFNDPAIMSARLASPILSQTVHDAGFSGPPSAVESLSSHLLGYGPPPGLFMDGVTASSVNHSIYASGSGPSSTLEVSQTSGSVHGESSLPISKGRESQVRVPSAVLLVRKLYYRP